MDLEALRKEIDSVDTQIIELFQKRMDIAAGIAQYKKENGKAVFDPSRERKKLAEVVSQSRDDMKHYTPFLFGQLFEASRLYQSRMINPSSPLWENIEDAIKNTSPVFPQNPTVACQGIEGANSQAACEKMFQNPRIVFLNTFEAVFSAIEAGLCDYGIIPIENSTAGSVNQVYDLMIEHDFKIIRSARVKIDHNLMALPGAKLSDIKEVISHPQALSQCEKFLNKLGVTVTPCENTAIAAKTVAESGRYDLAAISSEYCSSLYGLNILQYAAQDYGNNHTRFICISKNTEIYPGADKTSIMLTTPHRPGSLYGILGKFYALGINLLKLESRPIPNKDFEFMFYFDLKASVYSDEFKQLIIELQQVSDNFRYLGSYTEVVE